MEQEALLGPLFNSQGDGDSWIDAYSVLIRFTSSSATTGARENAANRLRHYRAHSDAPDFPLRPWVNSRGRTFQCPAITSRDMLTWLFSKLKLQGEPVSSTCCSSQSLSRQALSPCAHQVPCCTPAMQIACASFGCNTVLRLTSIGPQLQLKPSCQLLRLVGRCWSHALGSLASSAAWQRRRTCQQPWRSSQLMASSQPQSGWSTIKQSILLAS
jgi:hypothetical protein